MNAITLDTTNISEQLGIYDFFNIIIGGTVFIFSLCAINANIYIYIWSNMDVFKGVGLVILIYITGLILQEIGSLIDKRIFKIYSGMSRSILKSTFNEKGEEVLRNEIVNNEVLIKKYRNYADLELSNFFDKSNPKRFNDDDVNGYFFSVCQYYVAVNGKDKKVEKMRALFGMSKVLMISFGLLSLIALFNFQPHDILENLLECKYCTGRIIAIIYAVTAVIFYWRTRKVMRRFLLILLGTYDAIRRTENKFEQSGIKE